MAFLDNSGDIILDAVLTDLGRQRLSRGDGSFKIAKFALADDEIDYGLYNKTHASGSAYYDIQIMQTPVLEAFTNNTSLLKSRLISVPRTNILFLPTMVLCNSSQGFKDFQFSGSYVVAVNANSVGPSTSNALKTDSFFNGATPKADQTPIALDQGLDTPDLSNSRLLDKDLVETQYMIEIDNRFGQIVSPTGSPTKVSFVDDDNIATYYISTNDTAYFEDISDVRLASSVRGPRGPRLKFKIAASLSLATTDYEFNTLGGTYSALGQNTATVTAKYIDAIVRVTGVTTGNRLDIPVRFAKSPS